MKIDARWINTGATRLVFDALEAEGHAVYVVGGAVRDAVLGRSIDDMDLTTDALPEDVIKACEAAGLKTLPTGIEHGTVTVLAKGVAHEVTTFRRDVETDGRHAVVAFGGDIQSDAARRDLTINALYATRDGTVLDPMGGLADLDAGHVRFVGNPAERITEDALRILRYFRFHAWFGDPEGGLDPDALAAIADGLDGLVRVSAERILQELRKLLSAKDPAPTVAAMQSTGVMLQVLPGANAEPLAPLVHLENSRPPRWLRRLAVLGGDVENLRMSNKDKRVLKTVQEAAALPCAEAAWRFGPEIAEDAALILAASLGNPLPMDLETEIAKGAEAVFPLTGVDLLEHMDAGRQLGEALKQAEQQWIASGYVASKADLLRGLGIV